MIFIWSFVDPEGVGFADKPVSLLCLARVHPLKSSVPLEMEHIHEYDLEQQTKPSKQE